MSINDMIALHTTALDLLRVIQEMTFYKKLYIADHDTTRAKECEILKAKALNGYADTMKLLCQAHIEYALDETYFSQLNTLS